MTYIEGGGGVHIEGGGVEGEREFLLLPEELNHVVGCVEMFMVWSAGVGYSNHLNIHDEVLGGGLYVA